MGQFGDAETEGTFEVAERVKVEAVENYACEEGGCVGCENGEGDNVALCCGYVAQIAA